LNLLTQELVPKYYRLVLYFYLFLQVLLL